MSSDQGSEDPAHRPQSELSVASPGLDHRIVRLSAWATALPSEGWILLALLLTLAVIATGPMFGFSVKWQFAISMTINIINFLMLFVIQRTQRREAIAIQLKLNELIASLEGASNRLINVEASSEAELRDLQRGYRSLHTLAHERGSQRFSHSVEDAPILASGSEHNHDRKQVDHRPADHQR